MAIPLPQGRGGHKIIDAEIGQTYDQMSWPKHILPEGLALGPLDGVANSLVDEYFVEGVALVGELTSGVLFHGTDPDRANPLACGHGNHLLLLIGRPYHKKALSPGSQRVRVNDTG